MRPKKKPEPPVIMEPVQIARRSCRKADLDAAERAIMDQTATVVVATFLLFRESLLAALAVEHQLCGNWSTLTNDACADIENDVSRFVQSISSQRVKLPELSPRLVLPSSQAAR